MKKILTIVLTTMLMVFGGEAALAKDHDHKKCKDHKHSKGKVVYVDQKHRSHHDCKHCKSHRDKRYASKSCCSRHDDGRYSRNGRKWERERDHNHRGRVEDRRNYPSTRDRSIAGVILEEANRGGHRH